MINVRQVTHAPLTDGLASLAVRRREIRRHRHSSARVLASGVGWVAVILLSLWLLLSGIFGFLTA